jgi:hypothetical protein
LSVSLPGYTSVSSAGLAGRHVVSAACFLAYRTLFWDEKLPNVSLPPVGDRIPKI